VLYDKKHRNLAGPIAMIVGMAVSIPLFANQYPRYIAYVPTHHPAVGDLTFEVGFLVSAVIYFVLYKAGLGPKKKATGAAA
jgi:NCS1 family nucleobase:cation symporter-1